MAGSRVPLAFLLVAASAAATACGGGSKVEPHESPSATAAPATRSPGTAPSAASGNTAIYTIPQGMQMGLGSRDFTQYRITVNAMYRSGPFTRMGIQVTCVKAARGECLTFQDFGASFNGIAYGFEADRYNGFYLVDPVAHKEYLPVEDGSSRRFAAATERIKVGASEEGWVVFPGTPAGHRLDVVIPNGPAIENVPLGEPRPQTQRAPAGDFDKPQDTTDASGLKMPVYDLQTHITSEGTDERQGQGRKNLTLSSDVLFAFNKADLTPKATAILNRIASQMNQDATGTIAVTGYTDAKGTPQLNKPLSQNRAKAVSGYLQSHVRRRLTYAVSGKGEADPVAPNTNTDGSDNPAGRAKNRRVTISYKIQQPTAPSNPPPSATPAPPVRQPAPITWVYKDAETDTYQMTAQTVRRRGDLAVFHFKVRCQKSTDTNLGCATDNALQGEAGNFDKQGTGSRAGGLTLFQPSAKRRYYPLIDSQSYTLTTTIPDNIPAGQEMEYWAYFPAPDAGVTAIDVALPHNGPTIHNVPVQ